MHIFVFSPSLFTMFWALSAYDLHIPRQAYDREVTQVKQKMQQLEQDAGRDMVCKSVVDKTSCFSNSLIKITIE